MLPFQKSVLDRIHDPSTSDLLILARGLGLRRIVCTLLMIYDSPKNLVLLVNAAAEEGSEIGTDLGIMGCRRPGLRIVDHEIGKKERQELYKHGGLISMTSRILVVDMLQSNIPTDLITGIVILHAEKVTALSLEAFVVRLYREKNQKGFLKAFSDQPEHIKTGLSPLKNILKELQLRNVHIYPRFHQEIKDSLEKRKVEVMELYQHLTDNMSEIHTAIMQCMTMTLSELKRSNSALDLDDFTIENAYFHSFDLIVRRQLDPVWHKVGPKTRQLVNDLSTLRRLLTYLLTYDALSFHAYLEALIASNSVSASGSARQHQSPWLLTDAANLIFQLAKQRCYLFSHTAKRNAPVIGSVAEPQEDWEHVDEQDNVAQQKHDVSGGQDVLNQRSWLPDNMIPVLEELPKWSLLAAILHEIEGEIMRQESLGTPLAAFALGTNTVLIMTSSSRSTALIKDFLSTMDADASDGTKGRKMMEEKLRRYIWWKGKLSERERAGRPAALFPGAMLMQQDASNGSRTDNDLRLSEGLKRKDKAKAERGARRRIRGGVAPAANVSASHRFSSDIQRKKGLVFGEETMVQEARDIAEFPTTQHLPGIGPTINGEPVSSRNIESLNLEFTDTNFDEQLNTHYGLLVPKQTVLVRAYSNDSDDRVLAEIQPKFIIMYEPNEDFVRRIEVYRSMNSGLAVRVYHMLYKNSCEEHKLLASMRREKASFERLIKERAGMLLPVVDQRGSSGESIIKSISTRIAGGRKEIKQEPSQVIVDVREFRSTLPSLLHASRLLVIPATLTIGDYILTPDICVERKSIPDLISSFNNGRLYTQCELMSVHYKQPILLIEFEEHRSFSLEMIADTISYARPVGKLPNKKTPAEIENPWSPTIQSKLVLLTLTFPRLRLIWSSSPYASVQIFNDLKTNNFEPDMMKAISIGAEEDTNATTGVNQAAEGLLRCLPGVTSKNLKYVMSKLDSVRHLCEMELPQVQEILGVEPGKACWEFLHRGE